MGVGEISWRHRGLIMINKLSASALLVAVAAAAFGFDDQKKNSASDNLAEQIGQLEKEYRAKAGELRKEMRERTSPEPEKFVKAYREYKISLGRKLLKLAESNPEHTASFKALTIAFATLDEQPEQKSILHLLAKYHMQTHGIGNIAVSYAYNDDPGNLAFAEGVLKSNKNNEDQAKAQFAIGLILRRKAGQEGLSDAEREKATADAAQAFELLKSKYGEVNGGTLAKKSDEILPELKNVVKLVPGKEAPEIEGEDLDGKTFKLSDYRGKVVLLDYWAHW
jgi:hypothetical protein